MYQGYDFTSRPTTLQLIAQRRADAAHAQQIDRITAAFNEIKRRSPERHEAAREWATAHLDDLGALEIFALQELEMLDSLDEARDRRELVQG